LLIAPLAPAWGAEPPAVSSPQAAPPQEVVVTARKSEVASQLDRTVYDITTDVQSTSGTLSDVLTAIPSVDVDGDGNVSLRGDTHVLILIDGKPSSLFSGAAAGENLQSLPAKDIVRIEVMSNPPPQYKAEGAAGVINIITRRGRSAGLSGSVQASYGTEGRWEVGATLNYGAGALNSALSTAFRHDLRHALQTSDLATSSPGISDSRDVIDQVLHRATPPVDLSVDYALNGRQSARLELQRTSRGGLRTYTELGDTLVPPALLTQSSQRLSFGHDHEVDYDGKLSFTQRLTQPGETVDVTLHRTASENKERYDYTNQSFVPPAAPYLSDLGFREDNATREADIDYSRPLAAGRALKLGYGFEESSYHYASSGGSVVAGGEIINPNLVDEFQYLLRIHSAYASYEASRGAWDWLAGLRGELAMTEGRQLSQDAVSDYRYARLYPSLHADRRLSDDSKLMFAAGRRVTRPRADGLNPFVDHEFTPDLRAGNADLRPQYTLSFEAGYEREARGTTYSATAYHRHNTGTVTDLVEDLGNGFTLTTKTNLPRDDASGLEFAVRTRLGRLLSLSLSGDLFRRQIDASALGTPGLASTTGLNGKLRWDFRPTEADTVQVLLSRTDQVLTPQGHVAAINIANAGYRHTLATDLTAFMTVSDVFNGQRLRRVAVTPQFTQSYERAAFGRIVWAGVSYVFGSSKPDSESQTKFDYDQNAQ
jgi:outer membrane receptor protein involved in Fe transport